VSYSARTGNTFSGLLIGMLLSAHIVHLQNYTERYRHTWLLQHSQNSLFFVLSLLSIRLLRVIYLSSSGPGLLDTHNTGSETSQADETVIEVQVAERGEGDGEIEEIPDQLLLGSGSVLVVLLGGGGVLLLLCCQSSSLLLADVDLVDGVENVAEDTKGPEVGADLLDGLDVVNLLDAGAVDVDDGVKDQVDGVAEVSANGCVSQTRVQGLVLERHGGGLEMANGLSNSEQLSGHGELVLDLSENINGVLGVALSEQVVGQEPREVLDGPQDLVSTDVGLKQLDHSGHGGVLGEANGHLFCVCWREEGETLGF
jgi:hypothetical protein